MVATLIERTDVDVRIGVTQAPRELTLELADDLDREALKTKIEAALSGAVDVLWLTDRRNRDVGVSSAKIAYVEIAWPSGTLQRVDKPQPNRVLRVVEPEAGAQAAGR